MLTQQVEGGGDGPPLKVSETIVRNVRVLATDQRITDKDEDGKTEVKTFSNVTFEVTPRIAEKIAVAQSLGTAVAVAALDRRQYAGPRAGGCRRRRQGPGERQTRRRSGRCCSPIANRPIDSNTTFTTGGDVSRFQRRTVPASAGAQPLPHSAGGSARRLAGAGRSGRARSSASRAAIMSPSFRWELAKMKIQAIIRRARLGTALAALAIGLATVGAPAPASAQPKAYASGRYRPTTQVLLSVGEGQMINLPRSVASVWTSNPEVADVYVNGPRQMNLFGKRPAKRRSSRPPPTARWFTARMSGSARTSARSTRCCTWRCRTRTSR